MNAGHKTPPLCATFLTVFITAFIAGCGGASPDSSSEKNEEDKQLSYAEERAKFKTRLKDRNPAPQNFRDESPTGNVREVKYTSDEVLDLKAWVHVPDGAESSPAPALVYFHGGFAFGSGDMKDCQPFIDKGFVVMCPMFRGENGNPGSFEMLMGEVDDAEAAIRWLAEQPYVDPAKIVAFGHSIGGGVSALLSLREDIPLRHSGSCGGLYTTKMLMDFDETPFERYRANEWKFRVLIGSIKHMQRHHYAYLGQADGFSHAQERAKEEMKKLKTPKLRIAPVVGDHFSSLRPAMESYLKMTESDLAWSGSSD